MDGGAVSFTSVSCGLTRGGGGGGIGRDKGVEIFSTQMNLNGISI